MQSIHTRTQVTLPQMSHTFIIYSTGLPAFAVEDNNAIDSQQKNSLQRKQNHVLCKGHHTNAVSHA